MQFIKPGINLNFIAKRKIAFAVSALMILMTIISLIIHQGPKYGIDFAGGTLIQIKFDAPTQIADIKTGLSNLDIGISSVQEFGDVTDYEFLVRAEGSASISEDVSLKIEAALNTTTGGKVEIRRVEMVGPQVGKDLREKALLAMFFALLFITIYISGRFELKWMISGVMAAALMFVVLPRVSLMLLFNIKSSRLL